MQLLLGPSTQRNRITPGGILMRYNFEDALKDAMELNEHLWKFHQEHAGNRHYYVKEIQ